MNNGLIYHRNGYSILSQTAHYIGWMEMHRIPRPSAELDESDVMKIAARLGCAAHVMTGADLAETHATPAGYHYASETGTRCMVSGGEVVEIDRHMIEPDEKELPF